MYARTRFYVPPEFLLRRDLARDLFIYVYFRSLFLVRFILTIPERLPDSPARD